MSAESKFTPEEFTSPSARRLEALVEEGDSPDVLARIEQIGQLEVDQTLDRLTSLLLSNSEPKGYVVKKPVGRHEDTLEATYSLDLAPVKGVGLSLEGSIKTASKDGDVKRVRADNIRLISHYGPSQEHPEGHTDVSLSISGRFGNNGEPMMGRLFIRGNEITDPRERIRLTGVFNEAIAPQPYTQAASQMPRTRRG